MTLAATQAAPPVGRACWSCGAVAEGLFCATCKVVQPPGQDDHFQRLGLPRGFVIDRAELDRRYFAAQRLLHPDRFATRSARERAIAQSQAVSLNEAYETLRAPLARATYLLKLAGVAKTPDRDHTIDDPALLMEQMERREALADAATPTDLMRVLQAAETDAAAVVAALEAAFAANDLARATSLATRLKYLLKLADEARAKAHPGR